MSGIIVAEPYTGRRTGLFHLGIFVGVVMFMVFGLQLGWQVAYADRIYPGVNVSGVDVGNLSRVQARQKIARQIQEFNLQINAAGKIYSASANDLGVEYQIDNTVARAYDLGRKQLLAPFWWQNNKKVSYVYSINLAQEKQLVGRIVAETGRAPTDATVEVVNGVPQVVPDKAGSEVSVPALEQQIDAAVGGDHSQTIVTQLGESRAHTRASDTAGAIAQAKKLMASHIDLVYQGRTFTPTFSDIGSWLKFVAAANTTKPGLDVQVDPTKVQAYIDKISKSINVSPVTQKVNVMNGASSLVQAGQNGLAVDSVSLAQQIASGLQSEQSLTEVNIPTKPVAFQTQYNRTVSLNFGQYIEVNLSQQHLWVYQDHQVIFDSPVTSGATGAGFPTATGLFAIYAKETNRHLIGAQYGPRYNYDVFVQYWMPFYQGYGLHDASWRHGSFGGQDYYYGGSHGCINLPLATAAYLYNWSSVGTPVWVHT